MSASPSVHKLVHGVMIMLAMLAASVCGAGCDGLAAEKAAIRKCVTDLEAAYVGGQGHLAAELVTSECLDHYGKLLKVAMDGKRADVEKLSAFDRFEVLFIRHKSNRKSLKGLDGRGYQTFTTDQGWWSDLNDDTTSLTKSMAGLKFDQSNTSAWCYIIEDRETTRFKVDFKKVNGAWKVNELSVRDYHSDVIERDAKMLKMPVNNYIITLIEDVTEEEVSAKVWDPMPK